MVEWVDAGGDDLGSGRSSFKLLRALSGWVRGEMIDSMETGYGVSRFRTLRVFVVVPRTEIQVV